MKSTIQYLDEAKQILQIESDNAMAKHLKITRSAISNYRHGAYVMDDYAAAKIAAILQIDAMIVIAAANAEREKTDERRDYWRNFYERLGGMAASIAFVTLIVSAYPVEAAGTHAKSLNTMCIMLN